ncbi:MAG: selenocysteine-specific translation elongation factor [Pyrinomonadaceae bacterium]
MTRSIIVGTAGHIDHGKTTLVRLLTGIDADRLPEEKRRGITIDLGFAELDLDDVRIGFVDVPGHERFVKNMLAGAHGIDAVALVIAADEGVMPQTREHFEITRLLGIERGLVVLTKTDMVDAELLELVEAEAKELVKDSFLEAAPIVPISARSGAGLEELKCILREVALSVPARSVDTVTRLPIDRAFTMRGFGAVVTGTLVSGEISAGDEMELLPIETRVRVRGLQVYGQTVERAVAGQRTAVNLSGIEKTQLERGMVLAPAGRLRSTQMLDVELNVLESAARSLRTRARVRVHHGAAEILARVRVLEDGGEIAAGKKGFAQLRLESPLVALPHDRFILRSYSPSRTIAGGQVLDAFPVKHRGREAEKTRAALNELTKADHAARFAFFVDAAGEQGLRRADIYARTGWRDEVFLDAARKAIERGLVIEADGVYIGQTSFEQLAGAAVAELLSFHKREPLARGLARETLRERRFNYAAPEIFRAVLAQLENENTAVAEKDFVRHAAHEFSLSTTDAELLRRLEQVYRQAALAPPALDEVLAGVAATTKDARAHNRKILQLLIDNKQLARINDELFFHRDALDQLVQKLLGYAAQSDGRLIDVAAFKELAGTSRKYAIPLLEYFDRERLTRRAGNQRLIL